jgi:hypothetical protein
VHYHIHKNVFGIMEFIEKNSKIKNHDHENCKKNDLTCFLKY